MRGRSERVRAMQLVAAAVPLVAWFVAGRAEAEPNADDRALATALFNEGRALMSEGRTAEACPKLEESHRLDPSGGTILNLALCHEQDGRLARSWSEFQEAAGFARRDGRSDREDAAESHVRALEPRLSRLTIVVPESARVPGLQILRDGRELGQASWSTAMPVDGGEHVVRALAPGREPFTKTIVIRNESDAETVEVPSLATLPVAPNAGVIKPDGAPAARGEDVDRGGGVRRTIGWTLGALGLVQWGAAGYFGLQAFRRHADSNSSCPAGRCTSEGVDANDDSRRAADTSTVLAITGLATVATSVYLLVTSPKGSHVALPAQPPRGLAIGSTGSTIVLRGHF